MKKGLGSVFGLRSGRVVGAVAADVIGGNAWLLRVGLGQHAWLFCESSHQWGLVVCGITTPTETATGISVLGLGQVPVWPRRTFLDSVSCQILSYMKSLASLGLNAFCSRALAPALWSSQRSFADCIRLPEAMTPWNSLSCWTVPPLTRSAEVRSYCWQMNFWIDGLLLTGSASWCRWSCLGAQRSSKDCRWWGLLGAWSLMTAARLRRSFRALVWRIAAYGG